jgi:hypothetical protein
LAQTPAVRQIFVEQQHSYKEMAQRGYKKELQCLGKIEFGC